MSDKANGVHDIGESGGGGGGGGGEKPAKTIRDLGDRRQGWTLLYESCRGGYIGRLEVPYQHQDFYVLHDGACFSEERVQASSILPDRRGGLVPAFGPHMTAQTAWPLALTPDLSFVLRIPTHRVIFAVALADLPASRRLQWGQTLDELEVLNAALIAETRGSAPPRIVSGAGLDLGKLPVDGRLRGR